MSVQTMTRPAAKAATSPAERVRALDWDRIGDELTAQGSAMLEKLLSPDECREIASLYADEARFRSRIVMSRHGFARAGGGRLGSRTARSRLTMC